MRVLAWDVGIIHLAYCVLDDSAPDAPVSWDVIDVLGKEKLKDLSVEEVRTRLIGCLDSRRDSFFPCDHVLIENQPVLKNPTMKAVSSCLFDYFLIRGRIDEKLISGSISFTSATNKLRLCQKTLGAIQFDALRASCRSRYTFNKKVAIVACEKIVGEDHPVLRDHRRKKDDLADAFLLARDGMLRSSASGLAA